MDEESREVVALSAAARRVLGVLVEKAKTTPDHYPLTLNAIVTASNQKSNRDPKMDLDEDQALLALDELKSVKAVREVQGNGRSIKYRHAAYEWMDIDGAESAVMTELLLRGPQTIGEIRTRASRMHPFADLASLQPVVDQLCGKALVEPMSPPGRGQMFTHTLYQNHEKQFLSARMEKRQASNAEHPNDVATVNYDTVEKLVLKLEEVTSRIDELEKRLAELES
jgi:uncharacterized protein YceH (UPF0502 family)